MADGRLLGSIESTNTGQVFHPWSAASNASGLYMHAGVDCFHGIFWQPRDALFQAPGGVFGSRPVIENDAVVVGGEGNVTVKVTFPDITPEAMSDPVRWRWVVPPIDAEHDSGSWQPFNPTGSTSVLTVPIPAAVRTDAGCAVRRII